MTPPYFAKKHHRAKPDGKRMNDILRRSRRSVTVHVPMPETHRAMNDWIRNEAHRGDIDLSQLNEGKSTDE